MKPMLTSLPIRLLAAATLLTPLAPAQTDPNPPVTARDAYVDGWFHETAEADLESALKSYRRCVELGGDRELMAKALWRMGRIARAQGDVEAAKGLFEQAVRDFEGTEASRLAAEDLAEPKKASPVESDAVATARAFLLEMLADESAITPEKVARVFDTLSVEEIARTYEARGGHLGSMVARLRAKHLEQAWELFVRVPPVRGMVASLLDTVVSASDEIPDAVVAAAATSLEAGAGQAVARTLLDRSDDRSLRQLDDMMAIWEEQSLDLSVYLNRWNVLRAVTQSASPSALSITRRILARYSGDLPKLAELITREALVAATPSGDVIRQTLRELPPTQRDSVLSRILGDPNDRALIDVFLADPEPTIRAKAWAFLMRSDDEATRREALAEYVSMGPPWDIGPIGTAMRAHPEPFGLWVDGTAGDLREWVYSDLLFRVEIAKVMRYGLDRADPTLTLAAFRPSPGPTSLLRQGNSSYPNQAGWCLRNNDPRPSAARLGDVRLVPDLLAAGAASSDIALRHHIVQSVSWPEVGDAFAGDPASTVRMEVVRRTWPNLSVASRQSLMLDAIPEISRRAIAQERDAVVLREVLPDLPDDRVLDVVNVVRSLGDPDLIAALLKRVSPEDPVAGELLNRCYPERIGVLLWALDAGDDVPNPLNKAAAETAAALLEDPGLFSRTKQAGGWADLVAEVRARHDEVAEANRRRSIEAVVGNIANAGATFVAQRLLSLGARDEIDRLAQGPEDDGFRVALVAYGMAGDDAALRDQIARSAEPSRYLGQLVTLGRVEAVRQVFSLGGGTAISSMDGEMLAGLIAPADGDAYLGGKLNGDQNRQAVDYLISIRAVDRLARLVRERDSREAVLGMFALKAYAAILDDLPVWPRDAAKEAATALQTLTGLPTTDPIWPEFAIERAELIQAWRDALDVD